ncbi:hypothetical protein DUNSADRAFT_12264 [Dunaliella salina]|uniref:Uncharacterized protein n=1 Tax=Dunaliella salina TaxID=3046 RepID=A0ABQ7H3X9_DUNSA|nr:hypothetical protein DUNSADRAFT_12264 [Dunaliella salina]|eukprot:KAF5841566.1 hypothetical protein DUNSADRAFT_12264 [Dunaliella salina]
MERLLPKPDSRAAAITMLGKTLDLCPEKVASAKPQYLTKLWNSLDRVTEPHFQYDLTFILGCKQKIMGQPPMAPNPLATAAAPIPPAAAPMAPMPMASMPMASMPMASVPMASMPMGAAGTFGQPPPVAPIAPPAAIPPAEPARGLYAASVLHGHEDIVYSLAWDPVTCTLFSGGRESNLLMWDQAGIQKSKMSLPGYSTAAIDCHKRGNFVGIGGMPMEGNAVPPMVAFFDVAQNWKSR